MRKNIFFVGTVIVFLMWIGISYGIELMGENSDKEKILGMKDFKNSLLWDVENFSEENHLLLETIYEYSYEIEKDRIISQSILEGDVIKKGDVLKIVVSKGEIPDSVYQEYHVNELGMVPIMMYHGIVDMRSVDTNYIGGNVDKDGYQRTVEAFREDLEFYYQSGYRMIRLMDYVNGMIGVELGKSPIILTFDDGNENNFKVIGEESGELVIDPNCAVGVLEEFKKKYPDYGVTATFFVNSGLFEQDDYNSKILKWLVDHGYDIGNHTVSHVDFTEVDMETTKKEVGGMYKILEEIIPEEYVPIIALPYGSPYRQNHSNYEYILKGDYEGNVYETKAALRVGWEAEVSCFDKNFQPQFLKRIRAYDNDGKDFDIAYNFKILEEERYISDGDIDTIVVLDKDKDRVKDISKRVKSY